MLLIIIVTPVIAQGFSDDVNMHILEFLLSTFGKKTLLVSLLGFIVSAMAFRLSGLDWPIMVTGMGNYLIFLFFLLLFSFSFSVALGSLAKGDTSSLFMTSTSHTALPSFLLLMSPYFYSIYMLAQSTVFGTAFSLNLIGVIIIGPALAGFIPLILLALIFQPRLLGFVLIFLLIPTITVSILYQLVT
ncbi:hypothetical protein IPA_01185 [Ignicoccus pacificus DSM 13166]|uniref:Uncharacterized protein n=1 Tax=Ignicoccus pacificus DSM 13166 TaxID=940294 RepID=A0A977PJS8_9CREN|nr:hypothetical protein IPA_01185 [Ignicoccus pacificus DSM 13166]